MRYRRLTSADQVRDLIRFHNTNSEYVVLDCETTDLNPRKAKLVDIQLSGYTEDEPVVFGAGLSAQLLALNNHVLVGHSIKYDIAVLYHNGIDLRGTDIRDTLLLGALLDENRDSNSLDSYVKELWQDPYKEQFWAKYKSYLEAPQDERDLYSTKDIYYTGKLYQYLLTQYRVKNNNEALYELVCELQKELIFSETIGLNVDIEYLQKIGVELEVRARELLPKMRSLVSVEIDICELEQWEKQLDLRKTDRAKARVKRPEFKWNSSKQLINLLYDKLELPKQKNEKTKSISVDDASLEKIKNLHPVIPLIQDYREVDKIQGSFIEGTIERMEAGRVYGQFHVNGTVSGRLSSSNPNLQQLPRSGGVRGIYVPSKGHVLISRDFASLEIYIAANFTQDTNLKKIVIEGASMHDITAQSLNIPRHLAKSLNFAESYGCSHYKVAKLLGVSEDEGLKIHNKYWATYSGQKRLMDECAKKVDKGIPIITPWGRKRHFEQKRRNPWDKAYRQAWNFLVQSTGADCTNWAFVEFSRHLRATGRGRTWFPLHDEIIAEVRPEYAEEELRNLGRIMTGSGNQIGLEIPLVSQPSGPMERWED